MSAFFGYNRTGSPIAQVVSSEFATVTVGGSVVSLIQSFSAQYQQDIRPLFAVGDPNLYFVTGHPQGTVQVMRASGKTGFLAAFRGGSCGRIDSITISATQGQPCATGVSGAGRATFTGGIVASVGIAMQAGRVEIFESVDIRVAGMSL